MQRGFYLVGGFVRDYVLGSQNQDVDYVAVGYTEQEMQQMFGERIDVQTGFPVWIGTPEGYEEFGEGEIAMARRERSTGAGYRDFVIETGPDVTLEEDAQRRDFTINALYMNNRRQVIDPTGYGISDIERGLIRAVGDRTMLEDPIRIFRMIRFASRFQFQIENRTWDQAYQNRQSLLTVPAERIWREISKTLRQTRNLQQTYQLLSEIAPEEIRDRFIPNNSPEWIFRIENPEARIVAWTAFIENPAQQIPNRYRNMATVIQRNADRNPIELSIQIADRIGRIDADIARSLVFAITQNELLTNRIFEAVNRINGRYVQQLYPQIRGPQIRDYMNRLRMQYVVQQNNM